MDDRALIELYFNRDESAIDKTQEKYGKYLYTIAYNVLNSREDSEECVNDTYLSAWNSIPPSKPRVLSAFLGKIARNLAINKYKHNTTKSRNKNMEIALEELEGVLGSEDFSDKIVDEISLKSAINDFLHGLAYEKRTMFVLRYWYFLEINDIAKKLNISESNVKITLMRLREKFKKYLRKVGFNL